MKKMRILLLEILVLALLGSASMTKMQQRDCEGGPGSGECTEFVDIDGDGVCDNCDGCIADPPKDGTGRKKGKK